jgi:hypothetical protein
LDDVDMRYVETISWGDIGLLCEFEIAAKRMNKYAYVLMIYDYWY